MKAIMSIDNLSPTVFWLSDAELNELYTADYWNDIDSEKNKVWWIQSGDYEKLWEYLRSSKLYDDYCAAESKLENLCRGRKVVVADIAAGIGWTSALLSKLSIVKEIHCVDLSRHRIDILCCSAIDMFKGEPLKINRYVGSFYSTKFSDDSVDVVFLSQAFHHADRPFFLLQEIDRILKRDGVALIIGEHYIGWFRVIRRFFSLLMREGTFSTSFHEMFQPDSVMGDHYYRVSDYFFMATAFGLSCEVERLPSGDAMYILRKI